ncbi:uncharacterized protein [Palaemon carinicauda]|uniref:uncharacterized protein n=1 Tax=Palaemon carinicauda TaxID=392227 RepID=UPI0035B63534
MHYKLFNTRQNNWWAANQTCYKQGGQLAVVDTPEAMTEVTSLLQLAGIKAAWIGLYETSFNDEELPFWQLRTGTVPQPGIVNTGYNRCFTLIQDNSGSWNIKNHVYICAQGIPYFCQRRY